MTSRAGGLCGPLRGVTLGTLRAARIDQNQHRIEAFCRAVGASWQSLASQGGGVPDAVVGYRGGNYLVEIKNPRKPPSARGLTPPQQKWHAEWRGQVDIVMTEQDMASVLGFVASDEWWDSYFRSRALR